MSRAAQFNQGKKTMSNNQDNDIFSFGDEHPTEVEKNDKKPFSVSDELKSEGGADVFSATSSAAPVAEKEEEGDPNEEEKPKKVGNPLFESKGGLAIVAVGALAAITIGYFKFFAGNSGGAAEQVAYQDLPAVTSPQTPTFEEEASSQPSPAMEPPPVDMGYSDPSMTAPVYVDPQTGQPIPAPGDVSMMQPPMQGIANPVMSDQPQPPATYAEPPSAGTATEPTIAAPTEAPAMAAMSPQFQSPIQQGNATSNLLTELGAEQQKNLELMKENETLKKQLADARKEAAGLRKKVALSRSQPRTETPKKETTTKKVTGNESNSSEVVSKFKIKAIVEGLAWIESPLGQTLAVRGGDLLTSDMRVISIDPIQMVVKTNKGEIK